MQRLPSESEPNILTSKDDFPQGQFPALGGLSVVIPVGPGDNSWRTLLESFSNLPETAEVWLVGTEVEPADLSQFREYTSCMIVWVVASAGRASQLNTGARHSRREFLWFLHADSQFTSETLLALNTALVVAPDSIHYFDLIFQNDGPSAARLNAWGAWLRSHILRIPFGDQGLCMSREIFERLGGFPEDATYGEDHLLVWQAHRQRVPLHAVRANLLTSARKYRDNGWLRTTVLHGWRTWTQAFPQCVALLLSRVR